MGRCPVNGSVSTGAGAGAGVSVGTLWSQRGRCGCLMWWTGAAWAARSRQALFFPPQRAGAGAPRRWTRLWLLTRCARGTRTQPWPRSGRGTGVTGYPAHFRRLIEVALPSGMSRSRWPAAGWTRCTGGCASSARIVRRPRSMRCVRSLRGGCLPLSRYPWGARVIVSTCPVPISGSACWR